MNMVSKPCEVISPLKNKTIIGLKLQMYTLMEMHFTLKNKTIIGLKFPY